MTDDHDRARRATIHRMVLPDHVCPYGVKALELLEREGYRVDDRPLTSRAETDRFMAEQGVDTTPLIVIDGERIGGYGELRRFVEGAADA